MLFVRVYIITTHKLLQMFFGGSYIIFWVKFTVAKTSRGTKNRRRDIFDGSKCRKNHSMEKKTLSRLIKTRYQFERQTGKAGIVKIML